MKLNIGIGILKNNKFSIFLDYQSSEAGIEIQNGTIPQSSSTKELLREFLTEDFKQVVWMNYEF